MTRPPPFERLAHLERLLDRMPAEDGEARRAAQARQRLLTKPPGSLGRLEDLAAWLAGWQGRALPCLDRVRIAVLAGNHGVVAQGISAYPAAVTAAMVANFAAGGAAINQLARVAGAELRVLPLALDRPTGDITVGPAMDEADCVAAIASGFGAVDPTLDLLVVGEMGIGNTTVAAALAAALLGGSGADWAGPGTGLDEAGVARKAAVIDRALELHRPIEPLAALTRLGGRELAGIFGAVLAARLMRVPVVLDGFVATAAASVLARLRPGGLDHAQAGHLSAEPGHRRLMLHLGKQPLLVLDMRLGEASGAALAVPLLRAACACLSGMATFEEAGIGGPA
jgi:nicotinate-nucleotide--dimethylbenzimidazole phosphoribosyltransferase